MEEKENIYNKLEELVSNEVSRLECENDKLYKELIQVKAKLEVYERMVHFSDENKTIGFDNNIKKEG